MQVLYEDNHIIIINKAAGEIVQGDKTGDAPVTEAVKAYIKARYAKPGAVFLGVAHRLDRPVSGVVVFARTSKALGRLCEMFRTGGRVEKTYHALVAHPAEGGATSAAAHEGEWTRLVHYLTRNERLNRATAHRREVPGAKRAELDYRLLRRGERYDLLEVRLHTGRHHQIRCQLAAAGMPIRGDLKYGAARSNPDGSICLHARSIAFTHPVSGKAIRAVAPYPALGVWRGFEK